MLNGQTRSNGWGIIQTRPEHLFRFPGNKSRYTYGKVPSLSLTSCRRILVAAVRESQARDNPNHTLAGSDTLSIRLSTSAL